MLFYSHSPFCYLDCNINKANLSIASKRAILWKAISKKGRKHTINLKENAHKQLLKKANKPINNILNFSSAHILPNEPNELCLNPIYFYKQIAFNFCPTFLYCILKSSFELIVSNDMHCTSRASFHQPCYFFIKLIKIY